MHCQGVEECESRHSVGQLGLRSDVCSKARSGGDYRVHVPAARGRVMPEMASMSDDLPALCEPMTAIWGRSGRRLSQQLVNVVNARAHRSRHEFYKYGMSVDGKAR